MRLMSLAFSLIKYPNIYKNADKIHFKKPPNYNLPKKKSSREPFFF